MMTTTPPPRPPHKSEQKILPPSYYDRPYRPFAKYRCTLHAVSADISRSSSSPVHDHRRPCIVQTGSILDLGPPPCSPLRSIDGRASPTHTPGTPPSTDSTRLRESFHSSSSNECARHWPCVWHILDSLSTGSRHNALPPPSPSPSSSLPIS